MTIEAQLWGDLRSLLSDLDGHVYRSLYHKDFSLRDASVYEKLERLLFSALDNNRLSWEAYEHQVAPYIRSRLTTLPTPLWYAGAWLFKNQHPSSLLGNALELSHDPNAQFYLTLCADKLTTLSMILEPSSSSLIAPDVEVLSAHVFPHLQTLITTDERPFGIRAPHLKKVVGRLGHTSEALIQNFLDHITVAQATIQGSVNTKENITLKVPAQVEVLTLALENVYSITLGVKPSAQLKELYVEGTANFRADELSLRELFPSLEVFYHNPDSASLWRDRDSLSWFVEEAGQGKPLPLGLKTVVTSSVQVYSYLEQEHPKIQCVLIKPLNLYKKDAFSRGLCRLSRDNALNLRAALV